MTGLFEQYSHSAFQQAGSEASDYYLAFSEISGRAERLENPDSHEQREYIRWVEACLSRLTSVPVPDSAFWQQHTQGCGVDVFRHRKGRVEFCHLRLGAGGKIPYHDHCSSNGTMRLIKGDVSLTSFDVKALYSESMVLQSSVQSLLVPEDMVSFCQQKNNVHALEAGDEGAYILDVFTHLNDNAQCRYLQLDESKGNGLVMAEWSSAGA